MSNTEARQIAEAKKMAESFLQKEGRGVALCDAQMLARAYLALEARCAWKPIETAPRTGVTVFLWREDYPHPVKAKWCAYAGNPVMDEDEKDTNMFGWLLEDEECMPGCHEDGWIGWNEDIGPDWWSPLPPALDNGGQG